MENRGAEGAEWGEKWGGVSPSAADCGVRGGARVENDFGALMYL